MRDRLTHDCDKSHGKRDIGAQTIHALLWTTSGMLSARV